MKKLLSILIFTFCITVVSSQQLTDSGESYTEVVEVKLKKDVIYQKLREWISLNYKSSNDVVQLDTKEKIITKGNTVFIYSAGKYNVKYRISITMVFSIKDNKFKVDLTPKEIVADILPDTVIDEGTYKILMTKELLSQDDYTIVADEMALKQYKNLGFNDKKSKKMLEKTKKYNLRGYESYKVNKNNFDKEIRNLFSSIKKAVNKKDDW